jgi:hypothetical protein
MKVEDFQRGEKVVMISIKMEKAIIMKISAIVILKNSIHISQRSVVRWKAVEASEDSGLKKKPSKNQTANAQLARLLSGSVGSNPASLAQAVSRWLPTAAARGSSPGVVMWDLWWDKVALG